MRTKPDKTFKRTLMEHASSEWNLVVLVSTVSILAKWTKKGYIYRQMNKMIHVLCRNVGLVFVATTPLNVCGLVQTWTHYQNLTHTLNFRVHKQRAKKRSEIRRGWIYRITRYLSGKDKRSSSIRTTICLHYFFRWSHGPTDRRTNRRTFLSRCSVATEEAS